MRYLVLAMILGLFGGWRWWQRAAQAARLGQRELAWCARAYWAAAATLLASALACQVTTDYDGTSVERTIVISVYFATLPQAALFGFVLVPILSRKPRGSWPGRSQRGSPSPSASRLFRRLLAFQFTC